MGVGKGGKGFIKFFASLQFPRKKGKRIVPGP